MSTTGFAWGCPAGFDRLSRDICVAHDQNVARCDCQSCKSEPKTTIHNIRPTSRPSGFSTGLSGGSGADCGCPGCIGNFHCSSCSSSLVRSEKIY